MKKTLRILGIVLLVGIVAVAGAAAYVRFLLPNVGPAPMMKVELTPERIAKGKYLAHNVMGCMDCHSAVDETMFLHPVKASVGSGYKVNDPKYPQNAAVPNITPAGVGDWTDGELFRAITCGVRKDGSALFPLMPYDAFGKADPEDIKAVIAYLRTLPATGDDYENPNWEFPFNLLINTFPKESKMTKRPDPANELSYGRYLVTIAACTHCHVQRDERGAPIEGTEFTGGMAFKQTTGGTCYSSNITPCKETGIGNMTKEQFIARFVSYTNVADQHIMVKQNEFNTSMPWKVYSGMSDQDLGAIYTYLMSLKPVTHKVQKFVANDVKPLALK